MNAAQVDPVEAGREGITSITTGSPVNAAQVDPVEAGRERITGVTTGPQQTSTAAELSDEAKAILREAVSSPTPIEYIRVVGGEQRGEQIRAGGKNMIPEDADARTIAYWKDGLTELQKRGYISGSETEGTFFTGCTFFEVTKKGYEAADELWPE